MKLGVHMSDIENLKKQEKLSEFDKKNCMANICLNFFAQKTKVCIFKFLKFYLKDKDFFLNMPIIQIYI